MVFSSLKLADRGHLLRPGRVHGPAWGHVGPAGRRSCDAGVVGLGRVRSAANHLRTMSQQNVEIMKASYEVWNAGNMDALREMHDPDVIARYPREWPEPGPFIGRDAVMRQLEQLRETLGHRRSGTGHRLHRRRQPSCREVRLAWCRARPCFQLGGVGRLHHPEGQNLQHRVLLRSRPQQSKP
jgi:SnoaL-like protein